MLSLCHLVQAYEQDILYACEGLPLSWMACSRCWLRCSSKSLHEADEVAQLCTPETCIVALCLPRGFPACRANMQAGRTVCRCRPVLVLDSVR